MGFEHDWPITSQTLYLLRDMLELNFPGILALVKYLTYFVIEEHEVVIALEEGSIDRAVTKFWNVWLDPFTMCCPCFMLL